MKIDKARATLLLAALPDTPVTHLDAELIDDLLPPDVRPSAVLMDPPFSRSIGRGTDTHAARRHLRAALLCLAPDGRCGVILPDRIDTASPEWETATERCAAALHLILPGNAYAKHGTNQAVQLVVLRKGGAGRSGWSLTPLVFMIDAIEHIVDEEEERLRRRVDLPKQITEALDWIRELSSQLGSDHAAVVEAAEHAKESDNACKGCLQRPVNALERAEALEQRLLAHAGPLTSHDAGMNCSVQRAESVPAYTSENLS